VAEAGARILRGGAYKPRSSPYAFQGLGVEGLKMSISSPSMPTSCRWARAAWRTTHCSKLSVIAVARFC
jgi:hypothetical protein